MQQIGVIFISQSAMDWRNIYVIQPAMDRRDIYIPQPAIDEVIFMTPTSNGLEGHLYPFPTPSTVFYDFFSIACIIYKMTCHRHILVMSEELATGVDLYTLIDWYNFLRWELN